MTCTRDGSHRFRRVMLRVTAGPRATALGRAALLVSIGVTPAPTHAQQPATASPSSVVFDGVTVVDVEQGKLVPARRVVIAGNHIQAVGDAGEVPLPKDAQVVDARGKYLIPGLWDMHVHTTADLPYPLLIVNGVTGIRDAWSYVPLDTMVQWRQEILAGQRVGPPRQLLTGDYASLQQLTEEEIAARKAQGANFIKLYPFDAEAATAVRHVGLPFGGHVHPGVSASEASDSGMSIIDHLNTSGGLDTLCMGSAGSVELCQPVAERFRHNGTWFVPTLIVFAERGGGRQLTEHARRVFAYFAQRATDFWAGKLLDSHWLRQSDYTEKPSVPDADSLDDLRIMQRVDLPILIGTDMDVGPDNSWASPPGFALHVELAMCVAEGLTPLNALRGATLDPAKMLHATDSLGTVAAGKLADLVLLDADPLADITNTTTIRAVVANGRYFDRAALDRLAIGVQTRAKAGFKYWWEDGERLPMKLGESP